MPYHRRNLYILCTTMFLAAVSWNLVAPFLPKFLEELGSKGDSLLRWSGFVYAMPAIASIFAQPFWAKVGDTYGRKPMIIRAGFALAIIYFSMSICTSPIQLVFLRFMNGALTGFIPGSVILIGTNTPKEEAPKAIAIAQSATAVGAVAGPIIGQLLAITIGYRASMQVSGTAILFSNILVWLLVKEINKPQITEKTSMLQDTIVTFRSSIMSSIMLAVFIAGTFGTAMFSVLALHLPQMSSNAPKWFEGFIYSIPAVALSLSAFSWNRVGHKWGYGLAIQIGLACTAVFLIILTFANNIWSFAALYLIAGIGLAAVSPSMGALIATRIKEDFQGRAYGMQFSASMMGAFLAPIATSNIAAAFGLRYAYTFLGTVFLIGAILFTISVKRWDGNDAADKLQTEYISTPK